MFWIALALWAVPNFRVAPPYFQLNLRPGDVLDTSLVVLPSDASQATTVNIEVYSMVLDSVYGGPEPGPDTYAFSAKDWLTLSAQRVVLTQGAAQKVGVQIHVPDTVEPGGYFAIVVLRPEVLAPGESRRRAGAFIVPEYGITFWIRVGEGTSSLKVGALKALRKGKQVLFRVPVEVTGRFHRSFTGYLEVQDTTGQKIFEKVLPKSWVLPELPRTLYIPWQPPATGNYRVLFLIQDTTGVISYQETGIRVTWPTHTP